MEKSWKILENKNIILRKPEPEDLDFLFTVENDTDFWFVSETKSPYSRWQLKQHIENSVYDVYTNKELRLIIVSKIDYSQIGIIDLFEFDPSNSRAGVGIIICKKCQNRGIASEALKLIIDYSFNVLNINQLWCNIDVNNSVSIKLFCNLGFEKTGVLRGWKKTDKGFSDVNVFQLFKNYESN